MKYRKTITALYCTTTRVVKSTISASHTNHTSNSVIYIYILKQNNNSYQNSEQKHTHNIIVLLFDFLKQKNTYDG